jgi:hypothetical protein
VEEAESVRHEVSLNEGEGGFARAEDKGRFA